MHGILRTAYEAAERSGIKRSLDGRNIKGNPGLPEVPRPDKLATGRPGVSIQADSIPFN